MSVWLAPLCQKVSEGVMHNKNRVAVNTPKLHLSANIQHGVNVPGLLMSQQIVSDIVFVKIFKLRRG